MAEVYKRSQKLTSGFKLDQSNVKAAISTSDSLNKKLDQISAISYKSMEETAKRQGLQYAVTNKVSLDQIANAVRNKQDPSDLFVKQGTIFGDAAREYQAEITKQDFEYDLTRKYNEYAAALEAGMPVPDLDVFASDMQAEIDGYAETLGGISPLQSQKFRAAMTIKGNTVYAKALTNNVLMINAKNQAKIDTSIREYSATYRTLLRDSNYNFVETELYLAAEKDNIAAIIDRLPGKAQENLELWNNTQSKTIQKSIIHYLIDNKEQLEAEGKNIVDMIRNKDFGKMQLAYDKGYLNQEDADKLMDTYFEMAGAEYKFSVDEKNRNIAMNQTQVDKVYDLWNAGTITGEDAINQLRKIGITPDKSEMDSLLKGPVTTPEQDIRTSHIKRELRRGADPSVTTLAYADGEISYKNYVELNQEYDNITTKLTPVLGRLKRALGYSEYTEYSAMDDLNQETYDRIADQLFMKSYEAFENEQGFNATAELQALLNDNKIFEREDLINTAKKELNTLLSNAKDKDGNPVTLTFDFSDISQLKGMDEEKEITKLFKQYGLRLSDREIFMQNINLLIDRLEGGQ